MRRRLKAILLLDLAVFLAYAIPNLYAYTQADASKCTLSGYPVCLGESVIVRNQYGTLTALYDAALQMFSVYPNGTIFFDVSQLAPNPDPALQFKAQSYGNGTFDVRVKGPPAQGIVTDGSYQLSTTEVWGSGAEIVYTTATPVHTLIINYLGVGPGCVPICSTQTWTLYVVVAIVLGAHVIASGVFRRKQSGPLSKGEYIR